jgi:ABC-type lipoprotein export system ATPase subunit
MVTHDVEAAQIAGRQYQLDHGKIIQTGGAAMAAAVKSES